MLVLLPPIDLMPVLLSPLLLLLLAPQVADAARSAVAASNGQRRRANDSALPVGALAALRGQAAAVGVVLPELDSIGEGGWCRSVLLSAAECSSVLLSAGSCAVNPASPSLPSRPPAVEAATGVGPIPLAARPPPLSLPAYSHSNLGCRV